MGLKENIKAKRTECQMTLEELADKVGVSRQTIQRYESGTISNIPSDKIELMATALHTTPSYLMGWSDVENAASTLKEITQMGISTKLSVSEVNLFHENSYENLIIKEMKKLNPKGKFKLLDTAREMICNPLYNPNYEIEVRAAHNDFADDKEQQQLMNEDLDEL